MESSLGISGRIAILGAGREGITAFHYLEEKGVTKTEGGNVEIITEALSGHPGEAGLQARGVLTVCPFDEAGLEDFDVLLRSPGVSPYRDCIQKALAAGVRVVTPSTIWFAENPNARTIVITGTKGKSTTASLLAHLLATAGLKVQLAGNIGTPLLACWNKEVDWWVIELSSYQLADLAARPTLGLLLNLATDHLDWHGTETRYHTDKLRLADLVKSGNLLANRSDARLAAALSKRPGVEWFEGDSNETRQFTMPASLPGRHNRANLAACLAVTRKLGLDDALVLSKLDDFVGLPHRLREVAEINGVAFVDDSISTAPIATVAALESFSARPVILLLGGYERGVDWTPHADAILKHAPAAVITLPDNGRRILATLEKEGLEPNLGTFHATDLRGAMDTALKIAPPGGVVLLSPGAPSFPHFRDFEDRGRQFAALCAAMAERE